MLRGCIKCPIIIVACLCILSILSIFASYNFQSLSLYIKNDYVILIMNKFIIICCPSLSLVSFYALKSTFLDINIANPVVCVVFFFLINVYMAYLFLSFYFQDVCIVHLKQISFRQNIIVG